MLTEGSLDLQLLLNGSIRQLQTVDEHLVSFIGALQVLQIAYLYLSGGCVPELQTKIFTSASMHAKWSMYLCTVALHLCSGPKGALQAARGILNLL